MGERVTAVPPAKEARPKMLAGAHRTCSDSACHGCFPFDETASARTAARVDEYERFDEQWIIVDGENNTSPVGPFFSEAEAHAEYKRNQPSGQEYLRAPTVVRLMRPAFGRFVFALAAAPAPVPPKDAPEK